MKWIVGAGNHGCWLGSYELENIRAVSELVKQGEIFFDIGAHTGYFTLLAARLVGSGGIVIAFEPLYNNQEFLKRHLTLNRLNHVKLIPAAISEHSGIALFEPGENNYMGKLSNIGSIEVRTLGLDEELDAGNLPVPNFIKIDVEGAEVAVLRGSSKILANHHPILFISIHGHENYDACRRFVEDLGYKVEHLAQSDTVIGQDFLAF